jgi:hypothetical protein
MRSPLVLKETIYNFRNAIQSLIPENTRSIVFANSQDMELELYLSSKYGVIPRTLDIRIQDFWSAYLSDPYRVFSIAKSLYNVLDLTSYKPIKELYLKERDQNMRSALMLLMNRCSHHSDLLKDSFSPASAPSVYPFLETHKHFIPDEFRVEVSTIQDSMHIPGSYVILDLPKLHYNRLLPISEDTSFTKDALVRSLNKRGKWCLITNVHGRSETLMQQFDHFYINQKGYRTSSPTNKILFFKTN